MSLFIAGSETTATLLCGVTYLLTVNPAALKKLTEEVRSVFKSEDEIDLMSVSKLPYMLACLDEAMRMYPPAPVMLPRIVPKGGTTIVGEYVAENVSFPQAHDGKVPSLLMERCPRSWFVSMVTPSTTTPSTSPTPMATTRSASSATSGLRTIA